MKNLLSVNLLILLSVVFDTSVDAYLVRPSVQHPDLKKFAEAQLGKLMDIRFVIQNKVDDASSKLALQGPWVMFKDTVADKMMKNAMPVAHGPNRHLSSGAKSLDIVKEGFVIDMNGRKTIPFQNGSWEMAWKGGQRHGSIICAFDLPEEVSRNQLSIPACHMFSQFLVWTKDGLLEDQAFRRLMENKIRDFDHDKENARAKFQETKNPFAKAMLVHSMFQAMENKLYTPTCEHIPLDDSELVELENGLVLSKRGSVWTTARNANNFFGGGRPNKLGYATLNLIENDATIAPAIA
ncbi:hypothetical protein ACA910_001633 [Epithemia clementina (nom. ined.)]